MSYCSVNPQMRLFTVLLPLSYYKVVKSCKKDTDAHLSTRHVSWSQVVTTAPKHADKILQFHLQSRVFTILFLCFLLENRVKCLKTRRLMSTRHVFWSQVVTRGMPTSETVKDTCQEEETCFLVRPNVWDFTPSVFLTEKHVTCPFLCYGVTPWRHPLRQIDWVESKKCMMFSARLTMNDVPLFPSSYKTSTGRVKSTWWRMGKNQNSYHFVHCIEPHQTNLIWGY